LLTACSDDHEAQELSAASDFDEAEELSLPVEATLSASAYEEMSEEQDETRTAFHGPLTRIWSPPTGFYLYETPSVGDLFANQRNLTGTSIDVFLTEPGEAEATYHGRLSRSRDKWKLVIPKVDDITRKDYYFYGFIPRDAAKTATVAPLTDFTNGATLTMQGMSPITPSDVCVIIGAKEGTDADHDGTYDSGTGEWTDRIRPGAFKARLKDGDNYLFLLFDHLYSALRFSFTVDATYNELRTIVLKKVELKADIKAKYDATVTLTANDTGTSPITGAIAFTPDDTSSTMDFVTIYNGAGTNVLDGLTLDASGTPKAIMGGIVPGDTHVFTLKCTYDIYDKKDNLVRKNSTAENVLDVQSIVDLPLSLLMLRGKYYTVNLTVQPTYLYVMSEPDLDSPGMTID
jgi:hypothetical protein